MRLSKETLSSKVARRVFMLFLIAGFLPVLVISYISYDRIRDQSVETIKRQAHDDSRSAGLNAFNRLLTLETALQIAAHSESHNASAGPERQNQWFGKFFNGIVAYTGHGIHRIMGDVAPPRPSLNTHRIRQLERGRTIISIARDMNGPYLVLSRAIDSGHLERGLVVARPRASYLWNFGVYLPEIVCAMTMQAERLACSSPVSGAEWEGLATMQRSNDSNGSWHYGNSEYVSNTWDLFLKGHFQSENLNIMAALPLRSTASGFTSLGFIFPKALLVTALIVVVLSITQIRKYLDPLKKLTLATQQVRAGKFDNPVRIKSKDEFETLANSFNEMSAQLGDQFATLDLMSRIDRLILSARDTDHIILTLMEYLHDLSGADHVAVLVLAGGDRIQGMLYTMENPGVPLLKSEQVYLSREERQELDTRARHLVFDETGVRSYLRPLNDLGDRHFLVLPMRVRLAPIGIICLGKTQYLQVAEEKLEKLQEIANRVAVALVNKESEEKLFYQAHYDALTGLPNRYLFKDRLEQALARARRNGGSLAILFIDLDRFKGVNDTLGHTIGDELLIQVADRLGSCMRQYDTLARFGGDEFIAIVAEDNETDTTTERASLLSQRVLESFKDSFNLRERELFVAASIGIAIFPRDASDVDDLLKSADSAMYEAKASGRNTYNFFDPALNARLLENLELGAQLRYVLPRNELQLVYQPKVNCFTLKPAGAEALARWAHPTRGTVDPSRFIPIAEETGLILDIGDWVLRQACRQILEWRSLGIENFQVAVNISAMQFRQPDFCQRLRRIIRDTGVNPSELELEITESITIEDFEKSVRILNEMHGIGVHISIDDFGTGYSSMSYLQQFRVDRLKIDQSFVAGVPGNANSASIVRAVLALGHELGLSVTAEGVETEAQLGFMVDAGFDELQGYYFSKPLDPASFEKYCREKS